MKKNLIIRNLIFTILLFVSVSLIAQDYKEKLTNEGIRIDYKWRQEKLLVKNSPDALFLKITNNSDNKKLVGFEINYFRNGIRTFGSDYQEYCLKPGQTIRGKRWNLAFPYVSNENEKISDEQFSWELDSLMIENNSSCESGLRLRLVPEHRDSREGVGDK